ncbi:hypothetical protein SRHO_G00018380 [Serrasalmus rhombeus]
MPDSAFQLAGRQLFRADRNRLSGKARGGGLCVYINKGWCTNCVLRSTTLSSGDVEVTRGQTARAVLFKVFWPFKLSIVISCSLCSALSNPTVTFFYGEGEVEVEAGEATRTSDQGEERGRTTCHWCGVEVQQYTYG